MESMMILGFLRRARRGVKTMRPASALTSSGSPGRRPSLRRRGPGKTTWPFVESLVSMVRQSYIISLDFANCGLVWQNPRPSCWVLRRLAL
jgi:hypothetical protein